MAQRWAKAWQVPSTGAISRVRARLGPAPLRELFARVCQPLTTEATPAARYRRWRLVAVDGTVWDVADTPENDAVFGWPGSGRGEAKARSRGVCMVGFGRMRHARDHRRGHGRLPHWRGRADPQAGHPDARTPGPRRAAVSRPLFYSFALWQKAAATGADLLWRVKANLKLPVLEVFDDGSYRNQIFAACHRGRVTRSAYGSSSTRSKTPTPRRSATGC
jgi:hypothetical protein